MGRFASNQARGMGGVSNIPVLLRTLIHVPIEILYMIMTRVQRVYDARITRM